MNEIDVNPFRPTRWEHQQSGHHLIWFAHSARKLLGKKSAYVRGSRGSGKTTLLRSICWEDLAENPSLNLQKTISDFDYIGIYIRFPDHVSRSMSYSRWQDIYPNSPSPELEMHSFFSLVLELVCLERCLAACHQMRVKENVFIEPHDEQAIVSAVYEEFPELEQGNLSSTQSFLGLAKNCKFIVRSMNKACGRGTITEIDHIFPKREPGELLQFCTSKLIEKIAFDLKKERGPSGFKFCLDDCEVLSPDQQKSVNSIVRSSAQPVSWVISSVGAFFDTTQTFSEQQPLTEHDRQVVRLDSREPDEFRRLCQAVLSLRLYFSVSETIRKSYRGKVEGFFDVNQRLGDRGVNDIFENIVRSSTSDFAQKVRDAARLLAHKLSEKDDYLIFDKEDKPARLPYYQAYILAYWDWTESKFRKDWPAEGLTFKKLEFDRFKDDAFEAWLRRKQVAALLHFASNLGFRTIPYGGSKICTQLADGSVRDFLEILGEIYEAYAGTSHAKPNDSKTLDKFAKSGSLIGLGFQTQGIHTASRNYLGGISNRSELDAPTVTKFIDGIGQYTAFLQSNHNDPSSLSTSERGIFTVKFPAVNKMSETNSSDRRFLQVWNVIRQAELAGYIRTVDIKYGAGSAGMQNNKDGRTVKFRLHRRFAPHFGFSYRGAYEAVPLEIIDLFRLISHASTIGSSEWAHGMASQGVSSLNQLSLKLDDSTQDE